ncbi:MAG: response regulator transcription factor [Ignavibacteriaceae bacterium]|nr:response regulator transcription factor [Ignavibacteriaceae bacterium]
MKIFLVEEHEIIKEGLIRVFSKQNDIEIIGESNNVEGLYSFLKNDEADIVLIGFASPESSELDIIKKLRENYPEIKILVLSMYADERFAIRIMKYGASGFLTKKAPAKEFVVAVRKIMNGNKYVESALSESISLKAIDKNNQLSHEKLSDREFEVMRKIASGKRLIDIASDLSLSINTISTYRTRILEKMNMRSTVEIIRYVLDHNLQ